MDVQTLTRFFMWCSIIDLGLLVLWSIICLGGQDWVYRIHSKWFPMPRETFNVAIYSFLGAFKIVFLLFNVVPYVALLIIG